MWSCITSVTNIILFCSRQTLLPFNFGGFSEEINIWNSQAFPLMQPRNNICSRLYFNDPVEQKIPVRYYRYRLLRTSKRSRGFNSSLIFALDISTKGVTYTPMFIRPFVILPLGGGLRDKFSNSFHDTIRGVIDYCYGTNLYTNAWYKTVTSFSDNNYYVLTITTITTITEIFRYQANFRWLVALAGYVL